MKAMIPVIGGLIVFSFCSWRVHQDAFNRPNKTEHIEIIVYSPDGTIIRPIPHR
jgi:hypothetical protein